METILRPIFKILPLIFGLGFLGPVIAATLEATGPAGVAGIAPLTIGLVIGGTWGLVATIRGSWI